MSTGYTPLMTLTQVQAALGLSFVDEVEMAKYQSWLGAIDIAVRSYCKWDLQYHQQDVQYYDGTGNAQLVLRTPFVWCDTNLAVYLDMTGAYGFGPGAFGASTLLSLGTDYAPRVEGFVSYGSTPLSKSAILQRLLNITNSLWWPSDWAYRPSQPGGLAWNRGAYWPRGQGNIKVVADYGFAATPNDIQQAIVNWVAWLRSFVQRGNPVSSQSIAGYSYSVALGTWQELGSIRQLLMQYRDTQVA